MLDGWTAFGGAQFDPRLRLDQDRLNAAGAARMANLIDLAVR